jgi:8-oxo-dGTP pyrophosphatase MutT (NUDIX family)
VLCFEFFPTAEQNPNLLMHWCRRMQSSLSASRAACVVLVAFILLISLLLIISLRRSSHPVEINGHAVLSRRNAATSGWLCQRQSNPLELHGATSDPSDIAKQSGSCWCAGHPNYCLCTPSLAVDLLAVLRDPAHVAELVKDPPRLRASQYAPLESLLIPDSLTAALENIMPPRLRALTRLRQRWTSVALLLVDRGRAPLGLATMGGFIEVGETAEHALLRELEEETGVTANADVRSRTGFRESLTEPVASLQLTSLRQFYLYSDTGLDVRRYSMTLTFAAELSVSTASKLPLLRAGDDAKRTFLLPLELLFAADAEVEAMPSSTEIKFDDLLSDYGRQVRQAFGMVHHWRYLQMFLMHQGELVPLEQARVASSTATPSADAPHIAPASESNV